MTRASIALLTSTLVVAALALGCSGDDEQLPEPKQRSESPRTEEAAPPRPSPTARPDRSPEEGAAATTSVSRQLSETIELPGYYPEDGPVYPGAKPSQAQQAPSGRVSLVFGTDAPPDEAVKRIIEASEAKGWRIDSEDEIERGRLTRASKDGRSLIILTSGLEEGDEGPSTLVAVSVDP